MEEGGEGKRGKGRQGRRRNKNLRKFYYFAFNIQWTIY